MVKLTKKMIIIRILTVVGIVSLFSFVAWHYWDTVFKYYP